MRIQIFAQSLSMGGAERVAALWATGFVNEGHEVQFALMADESVPRTYFIPSCVSVVSARVNKSNIIANYIGRFKRTGRIIRNFKPDVILVVLHVQDIPIWYYTRGTNIQIIQTEHNSFERPAEAPLKKYEYFVKFYRNRLFDAVTVLTDADKKVIGNKLKNVYVLPNPLAFEPIKIMPPKKKQILAVGRLDVYYTKGFDLLIRAYATICNKYPDWKLKIVGTGKINSLLYLKNLAIDCGIIDSVEFIPFTGNILPIYKESEIFCLSSRFEGFGMVLIEAMSQGCACIACDYKGRQKEIIPSEDYGLICPADSVNDLTKSLLRLIEDRNLRNRIQHNSPYRSGCYNLETIMGYWQQLFECII